jgi:hypothetical protein
VCSRVCAAVLWPRLPVPFPSFNRSPARTARTHAEIVAPTSPPSAKPASRPPLQVPTYPHLPPASLILPLHTHPSCAHPFFKLTGASPSPGLQRPNPPLVELGHRPRACSATVRHSLAIVPPPPKVNFPVGPTFLSPPFSLSRRLVAGDRWCRYRVVEPRTLGQQQPPRAFFARVESPTPAMALVPCARPRKTAVLTRRTRPLVSPFPLLRPPRVVANRWTLGPARQHSAYPFPPFRVAAWRAPSVSARPRCHASACPPSLTSGPDLSVTPPVRPRRSTLPIV